MATALIYLVVLLVVAALLFVAASALFGRGEELSPIPPGSSPTWLPDDEVGPADVRALRFQQAVRGYRMAEVDWVLDRLAGELERLTTDREDLRRRLADLEGPAEPEPEPEPEAEPEHEPEAEAEPDAQPEPVEKPTEEQAGKPAPTEEPTQA